MNGIGNQADSSVIQLIFVANCYVAMHIWVTAIIVSETNVPGDHDLTYPNEQTIRLSFEDSSGSALVARLAGGPASLTLCTPDVSWRVMVAPNTRPQPKRVIPSLSDSQIFNSGPTGDV